MNHRFIWVLLALSAIERFMVLAGFAFRSIGIDDALVMQVAIDYGQGVFREPFLYGQNYNPMLEALLAAPIVRAGAAPWIALPIITSVLALLPFWSWSLWASRKGEHAAALLIAAAPLLLPVEWSLITSMPRGWVHGLAPLAFIPWMHDARSPWLRHLLIAFTLVMALLMNANALPVAAAVGVFLVLQEGRRLSLWLASALSLAMAYLLHTAAQDWYLSRPEAIVHPLLESDLVFRPELIGAGVINVGEHLLHMHPFGDAGWLALAVLSAGALALLRRGDQKHGIALLASITVVVLALGIPKVHEGCASVFFPQSRMMLGLPLLLATTAALLFRGAAVPRWAGIVTVVLATAVVTWKAQSLERTVNLELTQQECAWVREEPLSEIDRRCQVINRTAAANGCGLVVPIRWPGIKSDHRIHFTAHFACYACPVLAPDMPPVFGAGFERRSWIRDAHGTAPQGRVLFVGGDTAAWHKAIAAGHAIEHVSDQGIVMHIAQCDTVPVGDFILRLGMDDDLSR